MDLSGVLDALPAYRDFRECLAGGGRAWAVCPHDPLLAAAVACAAGSTGRSALLVVPDEERAERMLLDVHTFAPPSHRVLFLPEPDVFEDADDVSETQVDRVRTLRGMAGKGPFVAVAHAAALMYLVPSPAAVAESSLDLAPGRRIRRDELLDAVFRFGYAEREVVEVPGECARRGGIVDVFPPGEDHPLRIELSGDGVRSLRRFDVASQGSFEKVEGASLCPLSEYLVSRERTATVADYCRGAAVVLREPEACRFAGPSGGLPGGGGRVLLPAAAWASIEDAASFSTAGFAAETAGRRLCLFRSVSPAERFRLSDPPVWSPFPGERITIFAGGAPQEARLREILAERSVPAGDAAFAHDLISAGFSVPETGVSFLSNDELFSRYRTRRAPRRRADAAPVANWEEMKKGDFVVHYNEGIGRFLGFEEIEADGARREFVVLGYADGDKLYVPLEDIGLVHKYTGSRTPGLSSLRTKNWLRVRERVRSSIRDMAADLYRLYLERRREKGFACPADGEWQRRFEDEFIYEETPGQLRASADIRTDMASDRVMDRLVCGDSGYGKTEVAMRAVFRAVAAGKQAAVLVPTTVLALQHYVTFSERFADYPVRVEMLSRFTPAEERRRIAEAAAAGSVDVLIGTHSLLQDSVRFADLGLLVVDEEQRFGVTHKEKIKTRFRRVDVLTLTATPIPRTLYLSLSGLRDLSVIDTAPLGRLSVVTHVGPHDERLVREAIAREMSRKGQVFYLHNFVYDIERVRERVAALAPLARVETAHARMSPQELAAVMKRFSAGAIDVLVATTIVENGLDVPRANTLIVDNAHRFGLADLYQLRGRVGRYKWRAYAFLFVPPRAPLEKKALERLSVLRELNRPGSGYTVAMRDLEIRGAGNVLGREQHGFIEQVGFELYCRFWREAAGPAGGAETAPAPASVPEIPAGYVASPSLRFWLYRRLATLGDGREAARLRAELADRFGAVPPEIEQILGSFPEAAEGGPDAGPGVV